ncbi:universal stress protein [Natronorubrum halophilum]|uniref:universal stress protein n=1 Tax=Natronorubrum halophilum TaxID=1702106 RepID=UPI000EF6E680|nr:universal stress protein [Natronorubrum halophilum]
MVTRILVPTDGGDSATAALEHAVDLAAEQDATVHVLAVVETNHSSLERLGIDVADTLEREAEEIVSDAVELADDRGVAVVTHIVRGDPGGVIVDFAAGDSDRWVDGSEDAGNGSSIAFDLVAMGVRGRRGLGEYILGNVTDHVVNRSEVPVLTVRAADHGTRTCPYSDVLVPTDGSVHAKAAVELAATIAGRHGATVHLLSVMDELPEVLDAESARLPAQLEENLQAVLDEEVSNAERAGADDVTTAITSGSVPREVTDYAEAEDVDLIVMGTHGRSGINRHLLGSFTDRVIRTAPVPVLTTRKADETD